jgi:3-oxoacyl-[acyl-carrier protein] reductase
LPIVKIIRGRKAMVTGAASGIGRSIALALASEGADLFLIDIDEAQLEAAAREAERHGVEVVTSVCDLAQPAEISATVADLRGRWGRLNILINNAGIAYFGATHEMTDAEWRRLMAVNLAAPIQLVRELLPILSAEEEAHILNICSILGLVSLPKSAVYQASKCALLGFTAAIRAEYSRPGFGVTALCPGFVRTAMIGIFLAGAPNRRVPLLPTWTSTSAARIAEKAIDAIRRDRALVVITPFARVLWLLTRLSPEFAGWLTRRLSPAFLDRLHHEGWRRWRWHDSKGRLLIGQILEALPWLPRLANRSRLQGADCRKMDQDEHHDDAGAVGR